MNQRGSMNQRTDELERILNASKVNYSSPQVSQQPTLYEVQRRYAEDLKQLRQQVGAQLESRSFQLGFLSLFIPFCPPFP